MAQLTWDQLAAVALAGGFPPGPAVIAVAITACESGRDPTAIQAGQPYAKTGWGLWQITPGNSEPRFGVDRQLLVPVSNARAAHAKWAGAGGFSPWTTYEDDCYAQYLADAERAVAAVSHLPAAKLHALAASAAHGGPSGGGGPSSAEDWSPLVRQAAVHTAGSARLLLGYSRGIGRLSPHWHKPKVAPPAVSTLLWHPEEGK